MSVLANSVLRDRMIFNVGARRSGTYWLQRIVAAHPSVGTVPSETHLLSHGIAPLIERFHEGPRESSQVGSVYFERRRMFVALRHLCDEVFREFLEPGQTRLAERTPLHVLHLELISEIYPDAKVVHIIRDGRDVARSISAQSWGPSDVGGAAREWRDCVRAGRGAKLPKDQYLEVRYESLLSNPETEIKRLYRWLGLPAQSADVAFPLAESARQENVDRRGLRGVAAEKWRSAFDSRDLKAFNDVAGDLLDELGYPAALPRHDVLGGPRRAMRAGRAIASRMRG